jgi:hypothetical protein
MNFNHYFDKVKCLIIKFILKIQNYFKKLKMKNSSNIFLLIYIVMSSNTLQSLKLEGVWFTYNKS